MKEVTFNFSIEEINVILKGLAELPAKESFNLINRVYNEVNEAQKAPEKAPKLTVEKNTKG